MVTVANKLIRVGNSKAVIIPAKIIKALGIDDDTEFELSYSDGEIKLVKIPSRKPLVLPKVKVSKELPEDLLALCAGHLSDEDIKSDPRLSYIYRHEDIH